MATKNENLEEDCLQTVSLNIIYEKREENRIVGEKRTRGKVYKGTYNNQILVAVKEHQLERNTEGEPEFKDHLHKIDGTTAYANSLAFLASEENKHHNFIRYFGHTIYSIIKDGKIIQEFSLIVTELCECSVADLIKPRKTKTLIFSPENILRELPHMEILRQSTQAVEFLHGLNLIHRNLHPDNFLIACIGPNSLQRKFVVKLTDFQYSKNLNKLKPSLSETLGSDGWVAPESLYANTATRPSKEQLDDEKIIEEFSILINDEDDLENKETRMKLIKKTDSFILGCYYYFVLSGGKHPFGDTRDVRWLTIKKINSNVYHSNWVGNSISNNKLLDDSALDAIKKLIKYKPSERVSMKDILDSQYFHQDTYNIYESSKKPGLCIIISQGKYHNPELDLDDIKDDAGVNYEGFQKDEDLLKETFTLFGLQVLLFRNLRGQQIETALSPAYLATLTGGSLDQFQSLVVCFTGHGENGVVIGVDSAPVLIKRLEYAFNDNSCKAFKEKPKIFIYLACRGGNTLQILKPTDPQLTLTMTPPNTTLDSKTPLKDFLSLTATLEHFVALGGVQEESVFFASLCGAMKAEYFSAATTVNDKRDLALLFSSVVIPEMARNGQTPEFSSSLSKKIRFRQPVNPGEILHSYDGAEQPTFKLGRDYYEALGFQKKKLFSPVNPSVEYKILLTTIYEEARDKPQWEQKALAWLILNRTKHNRPDFGGNTIQGVCKKLKCWPNNLNIEMLTSTQQKADRDSIHTWLHAIYCWEQDFTNGAVYSTLAFNCSNLMPDDVNLHRSLICTFNYNNIQFYKDPYAPFM